MTKNDVEAAGLRTGDKLALLLDEDEYELAFCAELNQIPPRDELAKGARLLIPLPRGGETYAIQIFGSEGGPLAAKLKPLAAISARKIGN